VFVLLVHLLNWCRLTDPEIQYQYYPELAYNYSIQKLGKPSVSLNAYEGMVKAWPQCQTLIQQCQTNTNTCPQAQSYCDNAMFAPYEDTGLNPYDIRLQCSYQPLW
jgi:cathepsin A (carboxypeptidase C)